jgi:hypothetical protein
MSEKETVAHRWRVTLVTREGVIILLYYMTWCGFLWCLTGS